LINPLNPPAKALARAALKVVPPLSFLEKPIIFLARLAAETMAPAAALRLLFRIDTALYRLQGIVATRLTGTGIHVKHQVTGYHQFFIDRIGAGDRVLDVGCGNGTLAAAVAKATGATVVGFDISPKSIAFARERYDLPNLSFTVADANSFLPTGPFDVVILSNVLEHVIERVELLRKVQTALCDRLLIRVPMFDRDWRIPVRKDLGVDWRLDDDHKTEYTQESFYAELSQAGLEAVEETIRWGEIWATVRPISE